MPYKFHLISNRLDQLNRLKNLEEDYSQEEEALVEAVVEALEGELALVVAEAAEEVVAESLAQAVEEVVVQALAQAVEEVVARVVAQAIVKSNLEDLLLPHLLNNNKDRVLEVKDKEVAIKVNNNKEADHNNYKVNRNLREVQKKHQQMEGQQMVLGHQENHNQ